jgi:glycosyltransferase 2 family protein
MTENWKSLESRLFKQMGWLLPLGVAANLCYSLLRNDPSDWRTLLDFSIPFLVLALLLSLVPWLLNSLRLWNWLRFFGEPSSYLSCLQLVLGAEMGASVTPTAIGGGPVKVAMLMRRGLPAGRALTLLTLGTFEDASCNVLVIPVILYVTGTWRLLLRRDLLTALSDLLPVILGVLLLVALVLYVLDRFYRRGRLVRSCRVWRRKVKRDFRQSWRIIRRRGGRTFVTNAVIATVQWCLRYLIFAALAAGLGAAVDPMLFAALQWLCLSLMILSPTPGAAGGAEAIFLVLHSGVLPDNAAELMMFGWRFLTFYLFNFLAITMYLIIARHQRDRVTT